jgi:hypothetical protein
MVLNYMYEALYFTIYVTYLQFIVFSYQFMPVIIRPLAFSAALRRAAAPNLGNAVLDHEQCQKIPPILYGFLQSLQTCCDIILKEVTAVSFFFLSNLSSTVTLPVDVI